MADPMSTLGKKTTRAPLPLGKRSVPFRVPSKSEKQMFDEVTGGANENHSSDLLLKELRKDALKSKSRAQIHTPSDTDLMTSMMSRLALLERQLKDARQEINSKDSTIRNLQNQVKILELHQTHTKEQSQQEDRDRQYQKEYAAMQRRVHGMETFLADYGMIWVGDDEEEDESQLEEQSPLVEEDALSVERSTSTASSSKLWNPDASVPEENQPIKIDFDKVLRHIDELNSLAGEGTADIVPDKDGAHRLKVKDAIPLRLYKNGMLLYAGPFRPYTDATAKLFMKDLMDGYLPWELKERHPNGVPIKVMDCRNEEFTQGKSKIKKFPGQGHNLGGGKEQQSRLLNDDDHVRPQVDHGNPGNTESFLNNIPDRVVRGGRLIDVRGSIAEALQYKQGGREVMLLDTPIVQEISSAIRKSDQSYSPRPKTPGNVATIQVRGGNQTFIAKLRFGDTIATLRSYIDKQRNSQESYKLKCAFPPKVLDNDSLTLEEAGLTPNATLHVLLPKQ